MTAYPLRLRLIAVGLAALAGLTDAIGFRHFSGYFVSFMSGNSTRLAVDVAAARSEAWTAAGLIAGFLSGVIVGSVLAVRAERRRKRAVLLLAAAMLTTAAATGGEPRWLLAALMTSAMGSLNCVFLRDGEVAVGLTYMTGTLVRMGQAIGASLAGERALGRAALNAMLWLGFSGGALIGASLYGASGLHALWAAAALAWCGLFAVRRSTSPVGQSQLAR